MTVIAGASRYVNQVALTNSGQAPSGPAPSLLGGGAGATSLLDAARSSSSGIGLSSNARALNAKFLNETSALGNQILSLSVGSSGSIHGLQQEIKALRARLPESMLTQAQEPRGGNIDTEA